MDDKKVPSHIGIIMDGNGRWARLRGKKRSYGHRHGSENVQRVTEHAYRQGVKCITLYAFSTENFSRPKEEVDTLMKLLSEYLNKLIGKAIKNKICLRIIGDITPLTADLKKTISECTLKTAMFKERILNVAINYGGKQEIVKAVKELVAEGKEISEESIEQKLYTYDNPPLDLIIRTGGDLRISNFMMYQSAYAELYFTQVLWPDFDEKELDKALEDFAKRCRRYGQVIEE